MEPALTLWSARLMIPSVRRRAEFQAGLNARFGLDHLRPMENADIQAESFAGGWPGVLVQGTACGIAFAAILVFRSRTSLDLIYFQF